MIISVYLFFIIDKMQMLQWYNLFIKQCAKSHGTSRQARDSQDRVIEAEAQYHGMEMWIDNSKSKLLCQWEDFFQVTRISLVQNYNFQCILQLNALSLKFYHQM